MNYIQSENKRICLICGGKKNYYNFSTGKFRIEKCCNCALMRINPQPCSKELSALINNKQSQKSLILSQADLDAIQHYIGGPLHGSLLQINLANHNIQFKKDNLITTKLTLSEIYLEESIEQDIQILLASKQLFNFIIINVLHKVRNPSYFLHKIKSLLNEEGIVVAILPCLDSMPARQIRSQWRKFNPKNFWYFSKNTISRLFYNENFKELKLRPIKASVHNSNYAGQLANLINYIFSLPRYIKLQVGHQLTYNILLMAKKDFVRPIKKLSIIMPVFNEVKSVKIVIDKVLAKKIENIKIELIIIESNSRDGTREIIKQYESHEDVTIIWQDKPCGKGNAVRIGLEKANGDYILIQDADTEYDIEDYDALVEPLLTGEAAFVLGARHGGDAWKMRQFADQKLTGHLMNFGHWFFAYLLNIVYGLKLKDPFTMYKVFRADCLRGLKFECNRFDFDYELLIKLVKAGYQPIEIPVNYQSRSFKEGKKVNVLRDPFTWLVAIFKYKFLMK